MRAAGHLGISWQRTHASKVLAAEELHRQHGLPDIRNLLLELNESRKGEAYGEMPPPKSLDPETIALSVEEYVDAVAALVEGKP